MKRGETIPSLESPLALRDDPVRGEQRYPQVVAVDLDRTVGVFGAVSLQRDHRVHVARQEQEAVGSLAKEDGTHVILARVAVENDALACKAVAIDRRCECRVLEERTERALLSCCRVEEERELVARRP